MNFREAKIDRAIEIVLSARKLGFDFKANIVDLPVLYKNLWRVYETLTKSNSETGVLHIEYAFTNSVETEKWITLLDRAYSIVDKHIQPDVVCNSIIETFIRNLGMSIDAMNSAMELAKVIALMDNSDSIKVQHLAEAVQYRKPSYQRYVLHTNDNEYDCLKRIVDKYKDDKDVAEIRKFFEL